MIRLTIESLAGGGDGVGHADGYAVFVPFTAPGDLVDVEPGRPGQGRVKAVLRRVIREGASRQKPPCSRAGVCGGCRWLHVSYGEQVRAKREILKRALGSIGAAGGVQPMVEAPRPLGYRCRARLRGEGVGEEGPGRGGGVMSRRKWEGTVGASPPTPHALTPPYPP